MNGARVVTSKRKNKPNYREMLEKSVIDEISKVDKTNVVQKNKNTITMTTKDDLQETIMFEMKRTFGVVTKHERQIGMTIKAMEKEKKIDPNIPYKEKEGAAMKAIVENFILNEAEILKEDWEDMKPEKFHPGVKKMKDGSRVQVVFCRLDNDKDVNKIRSNMADKPEEISNKMTNYVHQSAYQRWKVFDNMAYQLRQKGKSTKIWHGKHDFLLLAKEKGDPQKWSEVAPRFIPEDVLIDFDVGLLSKEDDEYYKVLQKERFDENVAKNEAIKNKINDEEIRIGSGSINYDDRYYPCQDHQENDCEICYYPTEDMTELGQQTQQHATSVEKDSQSNNFDDFTSDAATSVEKDSQSSNSDNVTSDEHMTLL